MASMWRSTDAVLLPARAVSSRCGQWPSAAMMPCATMHLNTGVSKVA